MKLSELVGKTTPRIDSLTKLSRKQQRAEAAILDDEGYQRRKEEGVASFVSRVRILEIEANSQLPPLEECRRPGRTSSARPPFRPFVLFPSLCWLL